MLLHEAETKLKRIVNDKFEAAIQNGDRGSVERYRRHANCIVWLCSLSPCFSALDTLLCSAAMIIILLI